MSVRMYVCMCLSHSGMSICAHMHVDNSYVMCTDSRIPDVMPSLVIEDREERRFLTMEDGKTMWLVLRNVHVLQS